MKKTKRGIKLDFKLLRKILAQWKRDDVRRKS
jgi:hypothetical protein